jgi:hypothetical protein
MKRNIIKTKTKGQWHDICIFFASVITWLLTLIIGSSSMINGKCSSVKVLIVALGKLVDTI